MSEDSLLQKAKRAPLPCFGLEYNLDDTRCMACPHQKLCTQAMGARLSRVPLSKAKFHLVPVTYDFVYNDIDFEDPELANMERAYIECHQTIFESDPVDRLRDKEAVAKTVKRLECSVKLYMLSVMLGHKVHEVEALRLTERGKTTPFRSKMLLGRMAEGRFGNFRDLTTKEFGTFSLSSIDTLLRTDFEKSSPEYKMLRSEVAAGQCIIGYKMATGGPYYEHLYRECELTLDPLWLAIEPSYKTYVLDPYRQQPRGSRLERDHRHAVSRTIIYLKKHRHTGIMAHQAREAVMARAIREVLPLFGCGPDDFLISPEPLSDCLGFWNSVALALQHDECLRFVNGERTRLFRS